MSNDEYLKWEFGDKIPPGHGIEEQIRLAGTRTYNPDDLTEQDIIDFIKALENNEQTKNIK